ncbi:hypothetical protein [Algibacillus agarilyticus]|uniref:hypothetical protein n=1 Tax=Algibacillus agarilyticus TaxID=2234133 RepID=UPI000DD0EA53|nr:hypothetical protein [Algibacillus agarilyticus]
MANKQKLLDQEAYNRQLAKKKKANAIAKQQATIQAKMAAIQAAEAAQNAPPVVEKKPATPKQMLSIGGFILFLLIIVPYPKLIKYEKLKIVTESIYIPSFLGLTKGKILDSNGTVNIDNGGEWLYICNTIQTKQNCQRYLLVEKKGIFSVIGKLLE